MTIEAKKVYLIYQPSPTLGRAAFTWLDGSNFIARILSGNTVEHYVSLLQSTIQKKNLNWIVYKDNTESDIEMLIQQNASLLICIPGLKYQFYKKDFDTKNIIYLSTMEYANSDTTSVIKRIEEIERQS
ncbi:nitrogen fixation protein NifS [Providencia sp. 21OH12SH02B-Prov]|uniref:nitrogen fixation protein NifS n=1 Tax=unclassified Providencia TaxID=2633465 RepID=UPI0022B66C25|nr:MULTISPECIES: nitrogen fixation protein NifS [unclassified Providencia]WBA55893.1 nitrogen fixation protein NifS [Providencia sp. 21OH12SH02B-Prov]